MVDEVPEMPMKPLPVKDAPEKSGRGPFIIMVCKTLLIPLVIGVMGVYFEARTSHNRARTDASWSATAPAIKDLQAQVSALSLQVQLLQKYELSEHPVVPVALPPAPKPPVTVVHAPAPPSLVLAPVKDGSSVLRRELETTSFAPKAQKPLPARLDDLVAK